MNRRTVLKGGAALVALAAANAGVLVQRRRTSEARVSVPITEPWLGVDGRGWLKANLDRAFMRVPDRPHGFYEVQDGPGRVKMSRYRDFYISTNSERHRGEAFSVKRDPSRTRILALGDSITFGWGVADEDAFPPQLQRYLARAGFAVEVINAGCPAMLSDGLGAYLRQVAPRFDPDVVLFCRRPAKQLWTRYRKALIEGTAELPRARVLAVLTPTSSFAPEIELEAEETAAYLERRLRAPILDLREPFRAAQVGRGTQLQTDGERMQVVDAASGEILLTHAHEQDPLPPSIYALLEGDPDLREPLFIDQAHLDEEGCVLMAERIGAELIRREWV